MAEVVDVENTSDKTVYRDGRAYPARSISGPYRLLSGELARVKANVNLVVRKPEDDEDEEDEAEASLPENSEPSQTADNGGEEETAHTPTVDIPDLDDLLKRELVDLANAEGVEFPANARKAEIKEKLEDYYGSL